MSTTLRAPTLAIRVRPDRDRVILAVSGEVDLATVDDLDTAVDELRAVGWQELALDLRGVEVIGSTGLGWLLATTDTARTEGWALTLVDGSPALSRLLKLTGMRGRFSWVRGL
ncbi:anti-sigma B factor antagonist [Solirubrobacter pauli]|uniref:Anti-sigma factor antagonist n=1 Tax=Solirubrobacter pauli TaxID=166793 RepID=A0A660LG53_9ACTN|nr:STAS domain-containing protein [Solirubrobacter pauli]RKQ93246.1 anti-sigma B factor antagonist [Solirubrobacter pauli]